MDGDLFLSGSEFPWRVRSSHPNLGDSFAENGECRTLWKRSSPAIRRIAQFEKMERSGGPDGFGQEGRCRIRRETLKKNRSENSCVMVPSAFADHSPTPVSGRVWILLFPCAEKSSVPEAGGRGDPHTETDFRSNEWKSPFPFSGAAAEAACFQKRKFRNLFFRQELFLFPHFCRVIRSIRK